MSGPACAKVLGLVEVCERDVVEVVVEGGHRYHGIVERLGGQALLLYTPPVGGSGGYTLVALSAIRALRVVSCGPKAERPVCR